jgi:hypothetical protein
VSAVVPSELKIFSGGVTDLIAGGLPLRYASDGGGLIAVERARGKQVPLAAAELIEAGRVSVW